MALTANGTSGEIRVGGRQAAQLGKWTYQTHGGEAWTCHAAIAAITDSFLMDLDAPREIRLHGIGDKTWRYKRVALTIAGNSATIEGQGKFEVV